MNPFYPVSLNLTGRECVVIGDDREAAEKAAALREAGAHVRTIPDGSTLRDEDVRDAFFVISTPQDEVLSERLRSFADRHHFLLCCIDQPRYGFVAMAAIVKAGLMRVAISTTGQAPRIGKVMKEALQGALDARFARFIERQAEIKRRAREQFPDSQKKRREIMLESAEGFALEVRVTYPHWFDEGS